MSESMFLLRHTQRFYATHPREEGWLVYELASRNAYRMHLPYLLDCLRDWHPEAVRRRAGLVLVDREAMMRSARKLKPAGKGAPPDSAQEPDSYGWRGSVEIVWNGQDIHCWTFSLPMGGAGWDDVYLIATKSHTALQDFLLVLDRYGQGRHKGEEKEILVVNGENITIRPSAWEDVILPAGMAQAIQTNVHAFFHSQERYQRLGIPHRRGFVFAGPPGCGKTLTLRTLAYNTPAKFITVLGKVDIDDSHLCYALDLAEKYTPAVVILEDLDRIIRAEGISLAYFLNMLDGLKELDGVLLIATCNEPDKLDPALIHRPSRFDRVWRFDLPTYDQRLALLRRRGAGYFSESALEMVARRSDGFSMAYVQEIVVNALLECAHRETPPDDDCLLKSLDTLRLQRKSASKPGKSMEDRESVGFCRSDNGDR